MRVMNQAKKYNLGYAFSTLKEYVLQLANKQNTHQINTEQIETTKNIEKTQ